MPRDKPIRVYADTSVFGGVFDEEFSVPSRTFFEQIQAGGFALVTSVLVRDEINAGPDQVKDLFKNLFHKMEAIEASDSVAELRDAYLAASIVPARYSEDAMHVAYATVADCSAIVSWNFRHIVHFDKTPLYNGVNQAQGYRSIAICSPLEVIEYEDEDKDI